MEKLDAQNKEIKSLKDLIALIDGRVNETNHQSKSCIYSSKPVVGETQQWPHGSSNDTDSLQDLIVNYLSLIKSYKQLVEQLDQAKIDNSQLKISFYSLNQKYMRLKSSGEDAASTAAGAEGKEVARDEIDTYKALIEDKYRQQIVNLKSAYNHLYELYVRFRDDAFDRYNRLHAAFITKESSAQSTELL